MEKTRSTILLFATVVLSLFCLTTLAGCAGPSPTDTTQQFLDGLKNDDMESIQGAYAGDPNQTFESWGSSAEDESTSNDGGVTSTEMKDLIDNDLIPKMREFDYELSNEQINGDVATVDVKITTYALGDALSSFMSEYISQAFTLAFSQPSDEQMNQLATSIFSSKIKSMDKSYTDTVTVNLSKQDNAWKVDAINADSDIADALLGGMISSLKSYQQVYGSEN